MKAVHTWNLGAGLVLSLWAGMGVAFGAAQISVDSASFDVGVIYEGKLSTVTHAFKVKNTGDSVLRIQQVKPG